MQYTVTGANRDTGREITLTLEARDSHDAEEQANGLGIMVASVREAGEVMVQQSAPIVQQAPIAPVPVREARMAQIAITPKRSNSLGIASLVLGCLAFLICWIPFVSVVSMPLSGLGLLLALVGLVLALARSGYGIGFPIAGGAVCAIALLVATVTGVGLIAGVSSAVEETAKALEDADVMTASPVGTPVAPSETSDPRRIAPRGEDGLEAVEPGAEALAPDRIRLPSSARLGAVLITISETSVRKVEVSDFGEDALSSRPHLVMGVAIQNESETKKVEYHTWRGAGFGLEAADLTDNFGNGYKRVGFGFSTKIKGGIQTSDSIRPGDVLHDVLVFETPIEAAEALLLELPGKNLGEDGKVVFEIPMRMVQQISTDDGPAGEQRDALSVVSVRLTNKRFQDTDAVAGVYEQAIWWDATYTDVALSGNARAIKGVLEFADLFGEVHFRLKVTISTPLDRGGAVSTEGVGFKYNQFMDDHNWMRSTSLSDMNIAFRVSEIIYADGTTERPAG